MSTVREGAVVRARRNGWRGAAALVALAVIAAGCSTGGDDDGGRRSTDPSARSTTAPPSTAAPRQNQPKVRGRLRIEVLSSQADRVTGGDARIRVTPADGTDAGAIRVRVGDRDVTGQLHEVDGRLEGVVNGFVEGTSSLTATGGGETVEQRIRDWPLAGPMLSGPHLPLLACSTEALGLGAPTDADCSAPTRVTYRYVAADRTVKPLADPRRPPADVAKAAIDGRTVPLVVRVEQGTIDRSVYWIASIDPTGGANPDTEAAAAWNRRLVYRFGGDCGTTFGQGQADAGIDDAALLAKGYALATATANSFDVQCNDVLSAETALMVKERAIELLGPPDHTIGEGARGGAAQLHLVIQDYPGLVDGAVAVDPLPDQLTALSDGVECGLLTRFFASTAGRSLTDAQRSAITGTGACRSWAPVAEGLLDPTDGCDPAIPTDQVYDASARRAGIRCTFADANINQLARDAATGFANRPLDNVGVQYGLDALNDGAISVDQFLALNRGVGGYDGDGAPQAERMSVDPNVIADAYAKGRVVEAGGDLTKVPIIDVDVFDDAAGSRFDRVPAFALRDRLVGGERGNAEQAPGYQIWTRPSDGRPLLGGYGNDALAVLDQWLTKIDRDRSGGARDERLARNRPSAAVDNCVDPASGKVVGGVGTYAKAGPCRDAFPVGRTPRVAAGGPRAGDVLKCQLKAPDASDYQVPFDEEQQQELYEVFPEGVCDWTQAGLGQSQPTLPGRDYQDSDDPKTRA